MTTGKTLPETADVINRLADDAVVVGSFATRGHSKKDVDLVVAEDFDLRGLADEFISTHSEAPGHLVIFADPLPVEIFSAQWEIDGKMSKSFSEAASDCDWKDVLGITIRTANGA